MDLSRTMDASDVGRNISTRLGNKPARDVLDNNATGKRKRKAPRLFETGPAEDIGEGWTYKTYQRRSGTTEGQTDTYWFSPVLKKRFRSRQEINRFLELYRHARGPLTDEPVVLEMIDQQVGGRLEAIAWDQFRASVDTNSNMKKDEPHPWEHRIRAKLYGIKYTGDTDVMVSKVLAELTSMIDPEGPDTKWKRLTSDLLEHVDRRLIKEEEGEEGIPVSKVQSTPAVLQPSGLPHGHVPDDPPQMPSPKKRRVEQTSRKVTLPPLGEFNYWLYALVHFQKLHGHLDVACHLQTDKDVRLLAFAEDLKQRYHENKIDPSTLTTSQLEALTSIGYGFQNFIAKTRIHQYTCCLLYTSPSPRDISGSRMPSSA